MINFKYKFYDYDKIEDLLKANIPLLQIQNQLRNDLEFRTDRFVTLFLMDSSSKVIDVSSPISVESNNLGRKVVIHTQVKSIISFLNRNSYTTLISQIEACKMLGFDSHE